MISTNSFRSSFQQSSSSLTKLQLSPVEEFHQVLDRIEHRITVSRESYREKLVKRQQQQQQQQKEENSSRKTSGTTTTTTTEQTTTPKRKGLGRFLIRGRDETATATTSATTTSTTTTTTINATPLSPQSMPSPLRNIPSFQQQQQQQQKQGSPPPLLAEFLPIEHVDVFIEDLRRIAELCIIGENFVTKVQKRNDMAKSRAQRKWAAARDVLLDDVSESEPAYGDVDSMEYSEKLQLFDLFFERQTLATIVNLLQGESFRWPPPPLLLEPPVPQPVCDTTTSTPASEHLHQSISSISELDLNGAGDRVDVVNGSSSTGATTTTTTTSATTTVIELLLLPPLSVATQALQSISILIQNVSRVTSLYAMLSNNCINTLIDLPLHLYTVAEQHRYNTDHTVTNKTKNTSYPVVSVFASPQITELATHFVTFLKSLALRMNAETLQFFIKYNNNNHTSSSTMQHDDNDNDTSNNNNGEIQATSTTMNTDQSPTMLDDSSANRNNNRGSCSSSSTNILQNVEFPLYARALEFCAAHQDSFVRTTALNICLNTIRLTTISNNNSNGNDNDDSTRYNDGTTNNGYDGPTQQSSPDAILHNAKALPYHERLVIAQYACIPSRVEHLISPIFTKLAEHWTMIDEQIRAIDRNKHMGYNEGNDEVGVRNERVAMAKEKVRRDRLLRNFKDKVADLHDELLLLDDVFQVGLTVLNEQLVETMLATFVYPMLLQPLVIYCQRLTASVDEDRFSFSEHPFGRISADLSDVEKSLSEVAGPAKAALYTLASVFNYQSNRPLLRLLFTVLFHPLSPDSTSAPTVRGKLEVATVDSKGRKSIRLDVSYPLGESVPNGRTTYDFGTDPANRRRSRSSSDTYSSHQTGGDREACIFVLAPALAEILEFRGDDISLIARTRPNPYRQAFFKCLSVPDDMADIRDIAICTFDAALSSFQGDFGASILFGTDLKTFADDIPADERKLDSMYAHLEDDRGIGGSADYVSRRSLSPNKSTSIGKDLTGEVISSLCSCVVYATRVASDDWKLGYDTVAAHVLLMAVQHHPAAVTAASKVMEHRYRQAAVSLAEIPSGGLIPMGGSEITLPGSPHINDPDYEDRMFENFINLIFYDTFQLGGVPVVEEFRILKENADYMSRDSFSVPVASHCNLDELCTRVGNVLAAQEHVSGLREFNIEMIEERREGARVWFKVDAILNLLKQWNTTSGRGVADVTLSGVAITSSGQVVQLSDNVAVYTSVSPPLTDFLFAEDIVASSDQLLVDAIIDLDSTLYIPCVCEVNGPLDATTSSDSIESEGVTWQSLYVILHQTQQSYQIAFAQVLPATGGSTGRIVAVCALDRVVVERDMSIPTDDSPARRLSLYYKWFNQTPPHLFLYDAMPTLEEEGDFLLARSFTSRVDIWLENEYSANQAYEILSSQIFLAKAQRGRRVLSFLDPYNEHIAK